MKRTELENGIAKQLSSVILREDEMLENIMQMVDAHVAEQCNIADVISRLKFKLEINAGRIAETLLKAGKHPKEDENCHKAFLMLAHLEAIEDYINGL